MSLLEVKNLSMEFITKQGAVRAINDVSYHVEKSEILGIVGESGSGKSAGMLALMGLLPRNAKINSGKIFFDGEDISPVSFATPKKKKEYQNKMQMLRGNKISMIFQDPMTHLNPTIKIGTQLMEGLMLHKGLSKAEAKKKAVSLLEQVGIQGPEQRMNQYPFEFSGGMCQRILIAMALACEPKLIIADEPTTALDVTVQAQILKLLRSVARTNGTAVILITHDLGVVASVCDRVHIMYGGRIVEKGTTEEIFYAPKHPYTKGLLNSCSNAKNSGQELIAIPGNPPDLLHLPKGCAFFERCPVAKEECRKQLARERSSSETHSVCCLEE